MEKTVSPLFPSGIGVLGILFACCNNCGRFHDACLPSLKPFPPC